MLSLAGYGVYYASLLVKLAVGADVREQGGFVVYEVVYGSVIACYIYTVATIVRCVKGVIA